MKFINGAEVYSSNNEKVGTIERVVMDPSTDEISHLVVSKGFLLKTDKVIPISWIKDASEKRISLRRTEEAFDNLPDFEETHYLPIDWRNNKPPYARSTIWYPQVNVYGQVGGMPAIYPAHNYVTRIERNTPADSVALEQGAKVFSRGGEHVGNVEQVIANPNTNVATHFVISEGFLLKENKLVPTHWIKWVSEDEVHLAVRAELFEDLPEYAPSETRS